MEKRVNQTGSGLLALLRTMSLGEQSLKLMMVSRVTDELLSFACSCKRRIRALTMKLGRDDFFVFFSGKNLYFVQIQLKFVFWRFGF